MLNQVEKHDAYAQEEFDAQAEVANLLDSYGHLEAQALLEPMLKHIFKGQIVVSSSFGAESAILLHMVSRIDPNTPVLFMDTGKLFQETIDYRDQLTEMLGLTNVRIVRPDDEAIKAQDPDGNLWMSSTDSCCDVRKVKPFDTAIEKYTAVITGRKRYQATTRTTLEVIEHDGKQFKINPVANWNIEQLQAYMKTYDLPAHPLVSKGYLSIGCEPCTSPVKEGEDPRAGRWRGEEKTECGIHYVNGKMVRTGAPA
ncbi:MAG: phosphoadenylyl-sulfate reductase [Methyloligellaceae bacterium]